jgi:ABC-type tungstate transport system substrate-binding protein
MMVISFPLVARSVRAGIEQVDRRYEHIAATLGAGSFRILRTITLPLASRGIAAGAVLGFSRALGEFGATIMVAGAIPAARARSRSASTRWSRPGAKTRRGACCSSRRARVRRHLRVEPLVDRGPRVIDLSIDITMRRARSC